VKFGHEFKKASRQIGLRIEIRRGRVHCRHRFSGQGRKPPRVCAPLKSAQERGHLSAIICMSLWLPPRSQPYRSKGTTPSDSAYTSPESGHTAARLCSVSRTLIQYAAL
jgi:hypothetical protein